MTRCTKNPYSANVRIYGILLPLLIVLSFKGLSQDNTPVDSIKITPEGDTIFYVTAPPVFLSRPVYIETRLPSLKKDLFISPVAGVYSYANDYIYCSNYKNYFEKRLSQAKPSICYTVGLDATKRWRLLFFTLGVRYMVDKEKLYEDSTLSNTHSTTSNYQYLSTRAGIGASIYSSKRITIKLMAGSGFMFLTSVNAKDLNKDSPDGTIVSVDKSQFHKRLSQVWSDLILSFPTSYENINIITYINYTLNLQSMTVNSYPINMYKDRFMLGAGLELYLK